ncbi:protein TAPETUM DETERMINANT 1-like [Wolffia australiana]
MSALSILAFALLLFILPPGAPAAGCRPETMVVKQVMTGKIVEGKPQYEVTVKNGCPCSQAKVMVRCYGLSSVMVVDPRAIKTVDDTLCLVNGGRPLSRGATIKFRYAWTTPQDFPFVSSEIKC